MSAEVLAFLQKVRSCIRKQDGRSVIVESELRDAVAEQPAVTAAAVSHLLHEADRQPDFQGVFLQLALAVGDIYEKVTGDDSLVLEVQEAAEKKRGRPLDGLKRESSGAASDGPPLIFTEVPRDALARCDVYSVVRELATERLTGAQFADLRGRIALTFPLEGDDRPLWEIPEVRRFMAELFKVMPYFPYYLDPTPEIGAFVVFFGCLADPEAFEEGGFNATHPSVVERVSDVLIAVTDVCRKAGQDPQPALQTILSVMTGS